MADPVTGIDVLRRAVHARNRSPNAIALIASEIEGVGLGTLEDFGDGKADLNVEALQALTKALYPHSEYDAELNLLRSANRAEAKSLGIRPEPIADPKLLPSYAAPLPAGFPFARVPQPLKPEAKKPKAFSRSGWLSSWLQ